MSAVKTDQAVGSKILLCGCALMLIGTAIGRRLQIDNSTDMLATAKRVPEIVPLVPVGTGALLAFFGAVRMALTARPVRVLPLGLFLDIAAHLTRVVAARVFPKMGRGPWSLVLPLSVMQVAGLILLFVALLRLLIRMGQKRNTHSERSWDEARKE